MLGMSTLAFITPELHKLDEMISGVSSSIERPYNDFEKIIMIRFLKQR